MSAKIISYTELLEILRQSPKPLTLGIDGMAGSGKTTLAQHISQHFSCSIIHMDDFFLPLEMRTPERLAQPGGNVHYERFASEVLPYLHTDFSYSVFDCSEGTMHSKRHVPIADITVVEGSYSLHPALRQAYDLSVFLEITPEEQIRRIRSRNGESMLERFRTLWIPLENRYFQECAIKAQADYLLVQAR